MSVYCRKIDFPFLCFHVIDKQDICVYTLTNGFVHSFVDFFYLTHRPSVSPEDEISGMEKAPYVESKHMRLLQTKLMNAETAKRRAVHRYMKTAKEDVGSFLKWKNARAEL
mgnify:CR=1 FL=1